VASASDEWDAFVAATPVGSIVSGTVLSHHPFGFFVDLGWGTRCMGLVEIPNVWDPGLYLTSADFPAIGVRIERARVLDHTPGNHQVRLTIRPSDLAE
jgi:predicted RNA-binding protein with RPS1 domain